MGWRPCKARLKTKEQFGDYATYLLLYTVLQNFFIGGVNSVIQKYGIDDEHRHRFAHVAYVLFAVLLVVGGAGTVAMGVLFGKWSIGLALIGVPFIVIWWWARYLWRTALDAKAESALSVVASLGNSLSTLAFLTLTDSTQALIYGDFAGLLIGGLYGLWNVPRAAGASFGALLRIRLTKDWRYEMFTFGLPIWGAAQLFAAGGWLRGFVTRFFLPAGSARMGEYAVMQQLEQLIAQPMNIVGHAALPGLVQEKDERGAMYRELLRMCLLVFPFLSLAVAGGLPLLLEAMDLLFALFRPDSESLVDKYPTVHLLLLIVALGSPFVAVEIVAGQYAIAEDHPTVPLKVQAASTVGIFAVLLPLAHVFGLFGVLAAASIGELLKAVAYVVLLRKHHPINMRTSLFYSLYTAVACTAGAVPIYLFRDMEHRWLLAFPAVGIFFVGMVLFGLVHREDFRRALRAVRARGQVEPPPADAPFAEAPQGFERSMSGIQTEKVREAMERRKSGVDHDV